MAKTNKSGDKKGKGLKKSNKLFCGLPLL